MDATATALRFIAAINAHDPEAVIALMSEDHGFIDAWGGREDKDTMRIGGPVPSSRVACNRGKRQGQGLAGLL